MESNNAVNSDKEPIQNAISPVSSQNISNKKRHQSHQQQILSCSKQISDNKLSSNMKNNSNSSKQRPITDATNSIDMKHHQHSEEVDHKPQDTSEGVCFGCHKSLASSRYIVSVSGHHRWHIDCLRCETCNESLDRASSCYIHDGRVFCKIDYSDLVSRYSVKCSKCYLGITSSDWVRRAGNHVYHLACFSCDVCHRQMSTGEQFTLNYDQQINQTRLLCRLHFAVAIQQAKGRENSSFMPEGSKLNFQAIDPTSNVTMDDNVPDDIIRSGNHINYHDYNDYNQSSATYDKLIVCNQAPTLSGNSNNIQQQLSDTDAASSQSMIKSQRLSIHSSINPRENQSSPSDQSSSLGAHLNNLNSSKSKRVRTTFTDEQLQVLQTNFKIDSNPDGQDLERIANLTGLSKRVTQVWFQNSRARQKKYLTKKRVPATDWSPNDDLHHMSSNPSNWSLASDRSNISPSLTEASSSSSL